MLWVRLKQAMTGGAETILSVAVTLVFFLLLLGSLTFIFPSGIVLRDAMSSSEIFGLRSASASSHNMLEGAACGPGGGVLYGSRRVDCRAGIPAARSEGAEYGCHWPI